MTLANLYDQGWPEIKHSHMENKTSRQMSRLNTGRKRRCAHRLNPNQVAKLRKLEKELAQEGTNQKTQALKIKTTKTDIQGEGMI
jgi:superfamily I DNA and RNA helicase